MQIRSVNGTAIELFTDTDSLLRLMNLVKV